jgi:hypothetical protein
MSNQTQQHKHQHQHQQRQQQQQHIMQRRKTVSTTATPVGNSSSHSNHHHANVGTGNLASLSRNSKFIASSSNIRKNPILGKRFLVIIMLFLVFVVFVIFKGIQDHSLHPSSDQKDNLTLASTNNDDKSKKMVRGSITKTFQNNPADQVANDIFQNDQRHQDFFNKNDNHKDAREKIQQIRKDFYDRYGGETEAISMLKRGIIPASSSSVAADKSGTNRAMKHTAERILLAKQKQEKFVMSFGGYSVTVGRGNYYHQSYPFIMEKVLLPLFQDLGLDLVVRNSAIGGIPSFPYGWCLPNFLGKDSDVVSWDYGMNEGQDADAFESYLRQSVSTLDKRPMMILLDSKKSRVDMLKAYHDNGSLLDSIAVGRADVVVKRDIFQMKEEDRPPGFQRWDEWGAPKGSPGQSSWHPKMMEHELIGWMIAMYFVDAVEVALDMVESGNLQIDKSAHEKMSLLPPPVSHVVQSNHPQTPSHLLYGVVATLQQSNNSSHVSPWHMDPVSCRTSFLPNIQGGLSEIVVSGLTEDVGDDLKSRDDSQYNSGWVVDVGKVERDTKRKVERVGGLGYIDMKNAIYGIPQSGTLRLAIPHEGPIHNHIHDQDSDMLASHWFDTLVICEVNEKRGKDECKPETDMTFIVGGVESKSVVQITNAAAYLKKSICINVGIPEDAVINLKSANGDVHEKNEVVELTIDVFVSNPNVTRDNGACSISHVVWQSH